jgi:hypothetical protein
MKKCPYCGLENPAESSNCQTCQTDLDAPAMKPLNLTPLKRCLPYFLSFLIVTLAGFLYNQVMIHRGNPPLPPNTIVLHTTLTIDELAAKMAQVGVPRDELFYVPYELSRVSMFTRYCVIHAVMFSAFVLLLWIFNRVFKK